MKTNTATRTLEHNVEGVDKKAQISSSAAMFDILYNRMYTNKVWAIFRELFSNAWDSHNRAGTLDTPIDIHLPTALEPWFSIRDYGVGLSPEAVHTLFMNYGESDKNTTNDEIGGFGLGSKTPYAYTDQFTVLSYWHGYCYVFQAYLMDDGCPSSTLITSYPTDEPNGLEISVNIENTDGHRQFQKACTWMYPFISTPPNLNYMPESYDSRDYEYDFVDPDIDGINRIGISHGGRIRSGLRADVTFVIDIVPYTVDIDKINYKLGDRKRFAFEIIRRRDFDIYVSTGTLSVNAPREEITLDDANKDKAAELVKDAINRVSDEVKQEISQCTTWYEWKPYADFLPPNEIEIPTWIKDHTGNPRGYHVDIKAFGENVRAKYYCKDTRWRTKSNWRDGKIGFIAREWFNQATLFYRPKPQWPIRQFMDERFDITSGCEQDCIVFNGDPEAIRSKLRELGVPNELHELPWYRTQTSEKRVKTDYSPQRFTTEVVRPTDYGRWIDSSELNDVNQIADRIDDDTLIAVTSTNTKVWYGLDDLLTNGDMTTPATKILIVTIPNRFSRIRKKLLKMTNYTVDLDVNRGIPYLHMSSDRFQAFMNARYANSQELPSNYMMWRNVLPDSNSGSTVFHYFAAAINHARDIYSIDYWLGRKIKVSFDLTLTTVCHQFQDAVRPAEERMNKEFGQVSNEIERLRQRIVTEYPGLAEIFDGRPLLGHSTIRPIIEELTNHVPKE